MILYTIFFLISAVIFVGRPHANRLATCTNSTSDPNEIFTDVTMKKMSSVNFTDDDSEELIISSLDQEGHIVFPAAAKNGTNDTETLDTNYIISKAKLRYSCPEGFYDVTDRCYLNNYDTTFKKIRGLLEVILVIWSIVYMAEAVYEFTFLPTDVYFQNMALCPARVGFLIGCFMTVSMVPLRFACQADTENKVASFVMLFISFYFLFFCR